MKQIITKDGSITFHNEKYDETYHSVSGAIEEAIHKHAVPAGLQTFSGHTITILDFCFGLGYNSIAAVGVLGFKHFEGKIIIYALENDIEILKKIVDLDYKDLEHSARKIQLLVKLFLETRNPVLVNDNIELHMMIGDAAEEIQKIDDNSCDVCFFDPFSPKKQPEMWTYSVFSEVYRVMRHGAILTTYSCAKSVRENMHKAGFIVKDGPVIGRRAPATISIKD